MEKLRIRTYGDPILKQKAASVETLDDALRALAQAMAAAMYASNGIGLAAPQVGRSIRLAVVDVDWAVRDGNGKKSAGDPAKRRLRVYVNPEVVWECEEDEPFNEGCLSLPGIEGEVYRPKRVRVRYQDLAGAAHEEEMDGLLARCAQHEIDHLNGILFVDRIPFLRRAPLVGALNRIKKETLASLSAV